jgi:hypothetical protein
MDKVYTELVSIFEHCINGFSHLLILSLVQSEDKAEGAERIDDEIDKKLAVNINEDFSFSLW